MTRITMATLARQLDYQGKHATNSARKWAVRQGLPRYWRGRTWLVNQADVDAALKGAAHGPRDVDLHRDRTGGVVDRGVVGDRRVHPDRTGELA